MYYYDDGDAFVLGYADPYQIALHNELTRSTSWLHSYMNYFENVHYHPIEIVNYEIRKAREVRYQ